MIDHLLSPEAKAWLRANRDRLEAEAAVWLDDQDISGPLTPYPTAGIEELLLAELIDCLGRKLARPMTESLQPEGGWAFEDQVQ